MTVIERRHVDEIVEEVLHRVTHENSPKDYCIAFVTPHAENSEKDFKLVQVDLNDPSDDVGRFFRRQAEKLENYIDKPQTIPVNVMNEHGRPVSRRARNDIRNHRIQEYKFELAVLKGSIIAPITIENKQGGWEYKISRN